MSKNDDRARAIEAELAELENTLEHRYRLAFPNDPLPMMYWHRGYGPELDRLMEQAIVAGSPLTPEDLCKAQGHGMPPPDATV